LGGGCVHYGTLPSKSFRESVYRWSLSSKGALRSRSSRSSDKAAAAKDLPDMLRLLERKERVVADESKIIHDQLKRNGVQVFVGKGRILSASEVEVALRKGGTQKLTTEYMVIAVGSHPVCPAHLALDGKVVHDSNTILTLQKLPRSMVVLGAGIIGCEYASMFSMAGTHVSLIDRRHEILASVDREIVAHLAERFESQHVDILLETEAKEIKMLPGGGCELTLSNGRKVPTDVVLVAQGRFGNIEGLGLDAVGIDHDERGLIKVDHHFRTTVPTIYAVGDVIGAPALASTSMEQGRIAARHAFQISDALNAAMPKFFPYGIYTIPEISMIGPTEEELKTRGADFVVGKAHYRELARGQIVGDRWGLLKLLVDRKTLRILGVHIVGDNAADLIHIGQAVMAFEGDVQYFIHNVFNYPTLAEAYKTAAFHAHNQIVAKG
jgi:NAD(P) transhydrogenase